MVKVSLLTYFFLLGILYEPFESSQEVGAKGCVVVNVEMAVIVVAR